MKRVLMIIGLLAAPALIAGVLGWGYHANSQLGGGWDWITPILPYVIVGLIAVGGLTGGLMWLAFYSARRGYDEPYDVDKPRGGRPKS